MEKRENVRKREDRGSERQGVREGGREYREKTVRNRREEVKVR